MLLNRIRQLLGMVLLRGGKRSVPHEAKSRYPYEVVIREIIPQGCRFEVSTGTERHRIEQFGDEEEFTRRILEETRPEEVLYDIGACVGFVSVHAAMKGAHVIAFEPDPSYRSRLLNNLGLNNLHDVTVIRWAVSDERGEARLFTEGNANGRSPSLRNDGDRNVVKVSTDTIDNALARGEIPSPDILKLDIEGAEILALRGMKAMLESSPPRTIFIESHPSFLPSFGSSAEEVDELIRSYGYREDYRDERSRARSVICTHHIYRKA